MPPRNDDVTIEGARIAFRNFAGKEDKYNRAGDRNFCIILDPKLADQLAVKGWNIKLLKAREEGDEDQPYLQVAVSWKNKPPRIVLLSERRDGKMSRTPIDEELVEMLDFSEIVTVDVTITPYRWEVGENSGVKAYLKTMFMTIYVDPLELKYEMPDADAGVAD